MGEAKRREQKLKAALLAECDRWDRPGTDWERLLVEELRELEFVKAQRAPADQLEWGRMQIRECHANAIFYTGNDPSRETKHVLGWWIQGDIFVLHSIIESGGQFICITPQERGVPDIFPFIPDPKIEARAEGDLLHYYRNGQAIDAGLRTDPDAHRAAMILMRKRLLSGMKPWPAMQMADDEACERLGIPKEGDR
jgi:hypothetical protein